MQSKQMGSRYTGKEIYDLVSGLEKTINVTDDAFKYNYTYDDKSYSFPQLQAQVKAIIINNNIVDNVKTNNNDVISLILDKSNMYYESGGQENDTGKIIINDDITFDVTNILNIQGYLIHKGQFVTSKEYNLKVNDKVMLEINERRRLNNMKNHTCVHILQAAVNKVLPNSVIAQTSSKVCSDYFTLGLSVYGAKVTVPHLIKIETLVR